MPFDIKEWCLDNIDGARLNSTNQIVGKCPWCSKANHFYVDSESGKYLCFSCETAGRNLINIIAYIEGITKNEAQRFLMRNEIKFRRKHSPEKLRKKIVSMVDDEYLENVDCDLPVEFIPVYKNKKWMYPLYLKERGVKKQTAKKWGIGFARSGRYAHRIIIPIICPNGRSFTSRDVTGIQSPKYLNPTNIDHARLLLGWNHHNVNGDVVLVEGPIDAIKLWQYGINCLSLLGKNLHKEQLELICKRPRDAAITIMLDPEEIHAPYKVAEILSCIFENIYIAKLPDGVDPGSATEEQILFACDNSKKYSGCRVDKITSILESSRKKMVGLYS